MSHDTRTPDEVLADEMAGFYADPLGYVMFTFPWDTEASIQVVPLAEGVEEHLTAADREYRDSVRARFPGCKYGPDLWACQFLDELGEQIKARGFDGYHPVDPIRFATVSGHEIGKTAAVTWLIKFIMDTRPMAKGSVTAVTDEQLRTKTWAELGKWHHLSLTSHWFRFSSGRGAMSMSHVNPAYAGTWRCDARTSRKEKSESFAGQHSPTSTSFYIFDEASGVDSKVFEVREGGLSSGEPMVFDFGNGTRNSGAFYDLCEGSLGQKLGVIRRSIDSRMVHVTNKVKIDKDIEAHGFDSDWIRVRWRGIFPDSATTQFIASETVSDAMERPVEPDPSSPVVIGVDVARFGDDSTVIYARHGSDARSFPPQIYDKLSTVQVTSKVTDYFNYFASLGRRPAMIFVDETGLGGGVVDQLQALGYPVTGVNFGSKPSDDKTYRFRGDEMWGRLRDALPRLALPARDTETGERLYEDLTQREYSFTIAGEKINLESKTDMKKRGLRSPDIADALVLTYASEVLAKLPSEMQAPASPTNADFDPHADLSA